MTTACTVNWEVMSVMLLLWVMLSRGRGMALPLVSSQVSHAHLFTVLSSTLGFLDSERNTTTQQMLLPFHSILPRTLVNYSVNLLVHKLFTIIAHYYCSEQERQTSHIQIYIYKTLLVHNGWLCFTQVITKFNTLLANLYLYTYMYTEAVHFLYYMLRCSWDGREHLSSYGHVCRVALGCTLKLITLPTWVFQHF